MIFSRAALYSVSIGRKFRGRNCALRLPMELIASNRKRRARGYTIELIRIGLGVHRSLVPAVLFSFL